MIKYYINIGYTPNYITLTDEKNGERELCVQTEGIAFLMLAGGINRIMDKSACYEFLSRIAILLKHQNIVDNFFKDDVLFIIRGKGYKYKVTMHDIEQHLGIEICDSPDDVIPRKTWLKNIKKHWKTACIAAAIGSNPMLEKKQVGENTYEIGARSDNEISKEYLQIVDLFAREAIKEIPEKSFEELKFRVAEARQKITNLRKRLSKKPKHKFEYKKISPEVKEKIYEAIFQTTAEEARTEKYHHTNFYDMMVDGEDGDFQRLVYLAWLWENGYVRVYQVEIGDKKAYNAEVDPRIDFNYEHYDGMNSLDFGINIYATYYDMGLDKISHLLKEK